MGATEIFPLIGIVLVLLAILVPLWIGLIGMRRSGRSGSWWAMFSGMVLIPLGVIAYFSGVSAMIAQYSGSLSPGSGSLPPPAWIARLALAGGAAVALGMLLFAFGFCFHGLRTARLAARSKELEGLTVAMTAEINSLCEGGAA